MGKRSKKNIRHRNQSAELLAMKEKGITNTMLNNFKKVFAEFGMEGR